MGLMQPRVSQPYLGSIGEISRLTIYLLRLPRASFLEYRFRRTAWTSNPCLGQWIVQGFFHVSESLREIVAAGTFLFEG